jgi:hypothetical protein
VTEQQFARWHRAARVLARLPDSVTGGPLVARTVGDSLGESSKFLEGVDLDELEDDVPERPGNGPNTVSRNETSRLLWQLARA